MVRFCLVFFLLMTPCLRADEVNLEFEKKQVLYLLSSKNKQKSLAKYIEFYDKTGQHDYEILKQIAYTFIDEGLSSPSYEDQLLALFGISLANDPSFIHYLDTAMHSPHPHVQAAALHLLAQVHEDVAESLISLGLKSNFLMIRFEALSILVSRQAKNALGQVENLMNLLHPQFKPYFTEFFALHHSPDAIAKLKQMIADNDFNVRKTAILHSAKHGHDELIPNIRNTLTHSDPSLKETASFALGILRDSHSVHNLRIAAESPFPETRLSALTSLISLGDTSRVEEVKALAREKNLYAIATLGHFPDTEKDLNKLLWDPNDEVRLNAALALLEKRDPKSLPVVRDILIADPEYVTFVPQVSPGNAFVSWKITSPATVSNKDVRRNLQAITASFQEEVMQKSIDLPEETFLKLARFLIEEKKSRMIPMLMHLLENQYSSGALSLLAEKSKSIGAPLIRAYCNLALYRSGEDAAHRESFLTWLASQKVNQLIEFKPMLDRNARSDQNNSNYNLSPEEKSGLFIEAYLAIADRHEEQGINLLLKAMQEGHEKNCYPLAGVLLKSIL